MKNGRSKLPHVSLMLLALITPTEGFYSFIVLVILRRGFVAAARSNARSLPSPSTFLRFNFGRYTFKASSEFPVPALCACSERGWKHRRLLGIVLNTPREKGTKEGRESGRGVAVISK